MLKRISRNQIVLSAWVLLTMLVAIAIAGCHQQKDDNHQSKVNQSTAEISIMPFFSTDELPESPKPPSPAWRGVLIQAQTTHQLSRDKFEVPVYGLYKLDGSTYPLGEDDLRIYAVDMATKLATESGLGERDESPDMPQEGATPLKREDIADMLFTGHFNCDVAGTLALPPKSAKYRVWASLGKIRSNEILIEIIYR